MKTRTLAGAPPRYCASPPRVAYLTNGPARVKTRHWRWKRSKRGGGHGCALRRLNYPQPSGSPTRPRVVSQHILRNHDQRGIPRASKRPPDTLRRSPPRARKRRNTARGGFGHLRAVPPRLQDNFDHGRKSHDPRRPRGIQRHAPPRGRMRRKAWRGGPFFTWDGRQITPALHGLRREPPPMSAAPSQAGPPRGTRHRGRSKGKPAPDSRCVFRCGFRYGFRMDFRGRSSA